MSEETALVPIEERQVDFYGDEITAALVQVKEHPEVYVPLRPLCDYLGLDWSAQYRRVKRDQVLAEALNSVAMTTTQTKGVGRGRRDLVCIQLEILPGWLFGIDASRVKPELKEKILRYQRECYRVLWQTFQSDILTAQQSQEREATSAGTTALLQIREMGLAIARMAEQQIELEQRVNSRLDRAALVVGDIQRRLGVVEMKLTPPVFITDEQAAEVSQRVKALAEFLAGKDKAKNHYQGIFGELYRRFGVSSYKSIPLSRYEDVLKFLEEWRRAGDEGESLKSL